MLVPSTVSTDHRDTRLDSEPRDAPGPGRPGAAVCICNLCDEKRRADERAQSSHDSPNKQARSASLSLKLCEKLCEKVLRLGGPP